MKKVLVTSRSFGSISDEPKRILEDAGFEITFKGKDLKLEEFEAIIPEYDALIIGAHAFRPEVMERCGNLKLIASTAPALTTFRWTSAASWASRSATRGHQLQRRGGPGRGSDALLLPLHCTG